MMQPDVLSYHAFYESPLGREVSRQIGRQIGRFWTRVEGLAVTGLGYPVPYLNQLEAGGANCFALMPARQGVFHWPTPTDNIAALVNPHCLPFADSSLDRLLVIHALEHSGRPEHMLREIWRVLAPSGEVVITVPNRRRVWSAVETTPFGHGRPFSKVQLARMMADHMLPPKDAETVLMTPPIKTRFGAKVLKLSERPLGLFGRGFLGGVLMVRASKQMYGILPRPKKQPARQPVTVPGLAPQSSCSGP